MAQSSEQFGLYKEAYKYHVVFKTMNDSIYNEEEIKKIARLEYQYKFEKEKQAIEIEQQKKEAISTENIKHQKILRNIFIIGFIIMMLFVLVIFYSLLKKREANRILAIQKNEINKKNNELLILNDEVRENSEELRITNIKLNEVNATKDKFFSIISHDLKSPFNAILGFSEILLKEHKDYDDEEREERIKHVYNSANSTFKLLEDLLTWAHSQLGKITSSPEKLHLKRLLFETILDLQEPANKKNIQVSDTISENDIIFADKNMIATVLRNLISNAIKFTNKDGSIVISSEKQANSNFLEISVTDTGVGIPKDKINDLFRIEKSTSTKGTENETGTGLGLMLCKEFVEKHGGEIWAESQIGKGSIFNFTIPKTTNKN